MRKNVNISQLFPTSTSVNENTAYQERKAENINLKKREFKASSSQINTEDDSTDDSSMSYQNPSKARKNSTTKNNENDNALRDLMQQLIFVQS